MEYHFGEVARHNQLLSRAYSKSQFSIQYEFVITMQMLTKTGKSANKSPFQGGNEFGDSRRNGGCARGLFQA